jgi:hypothetical protein
MTIDEKTELNEVIRKLRFVVEMYNKRWEFKSTAIREGIEEAIGMLRKLGETP